MTTEHPAPYPNPGKCEGACRVWKGSWVGWSNERCQRQAVGFHEPTFRWLCTVHLHRQRKTAARKTAQVVAGDYDVDSFEVYKTPTGHDAIARKARRPT